MFPAYTRQPKRQALQMNYFISCSAIISRNMKCFHQWLIVYFTIWSNQTTKCLELCSWSYAGSWITGGSWTDKGWGASCTTDNHKSTDTVSLLKLMKCKCKMSGCRQNCSCSNTGLACTAGCFCMAEDEACGNPFGLTYVSDLEESNEESSFGEEL